MPQYFYQPGYSSPKVVKCNTNLDKTFLIEIINDFKKILAYLPVGVFPSTLNADIAFEAQVQATQEINLSLQGTVMFLYARVFGEPYPSKPTSDQRARINSIWTGIGRPENMIAS